jgi:RNA polymerase sigma-70 factor (ECF subfamily)
MTAATALLESEGPPRAETSPSGDELHRVVTRDYKSVWRFLRHLGIPASDVDDAAQTVFARVLARREVVQAGLERAYLMKAALHLSFEYRRAQRRYQRRVAEFEPEQLCAAAASADEALVRYEDRALLDAALDELPLQLRAAFTLFELEELSFTEIASVLEIPRGTVASRIRRGRELFTQAAIRLTRRGAP